MFKDGAKNKNGTSVKTKEDSKLTDSYRQPYCDMAFVKRGCTKGASWFKTDDLPEGKFKTYENMEKALYSNGLNKNDLRVGWSLAKRIDKYGVDLYWNYFTVDCFSNSLSLLNICLDKPVATILSSK